MVALLELVIRHLCSTCSHVHLTLLAYWNCSIFILNSRCVLSSLNGGSDILCRPHFDFSFIYMMISSLIVSVTHNSIYLSLSSIKIYIFYVPSTLISFPKAPVVFHVPHSLISLLFDRCADKRFTSVAPAVNLPIFLCLYLLL